MIYGGPTFDTSHLFYHYANNVTGNLNSFQLKCRFKLDFELKATSVTINLRYFSW